MIISDITTIVALLVSLIALVFSITIYKRDRRKDLEAYLYKEKQIRYQEMLSIGRRLIYLELKNIEDEIENDKISSSVNRLLELSDELMLLAPAYISGKAADLAISMRKMFLVFIEKDVNEHNRLLEYNIKQHTSLLVEFLEDLSIHNLNLSLQRRAKSGFSKREMKIMMDRVYRDVLDDDSNEDLKFK